MQIEDIFVYVEVERFGDWCFEVDVKFEDYYFEEGVDFCRRLRSIEDFVRISRSLRSFEQEWMEVFEPVPCLERKSTMEASHQSKH